jgi:uncharacterized membrane protein YoaK (UPF0700 family)
MWISFSFGAVTGAVIVSSFHNVGLLGVVLPIILLILFELKKIGSDTADGGAQQD